MVRFPSCNDFAPYEYRITDVILLRRGIDARVKVSLITILSFYKLRLCGVHEGP